MNDGQTVLYQVGMKLEELEKLAILKAYKHFRNNKTVTASSLGIAIRTLDSKLEKYEIEELEHKERVQNEQSRREEFLARARGNPPNNIGVPFNPSQRNNHESFERHFPSTPAGPRMESIANTAAQQPLSMPEPQKVQELLHADSSKGSKGRAR